MLAALIVIAVTLVLMFLVLLVICSHLEDLVKVLAAYVSDRFKEEIQ